MVMTLFLLTGVVYIYTSIMTFSNNSWVRARRDYAISQMCLFFTCLFYGLMTVTISEEMVRWFWAAGFISYYLFFPAWIRFTSNMITIKSKIIEMIVRRILIIISLTLSLVYVFFSDVAFVSTNFGYQFSYRYIPYFRVTGFYLLFLAICLFITHIKWLHESKMKRQKKQQRSFLVLTSFATMAGFVTDYAIPVFTDYTFTPLLAIAVIPATIQMYKLIQTNNTLSITIPNASRYIFKSVTMPILVLGPDNVVSIENDTALRFLGNSQIGKNISEVITSLDVMQKSTFYDMDFTGKNVTVNTPSGIKLCEMLLSVERDKYGDAICKVIVLRDITEKEEANMITRIMLDSSPLCCDLWNKDMKIFECNEAGVKMFHFKNKQEYMSRLEECYPEFQTDGQPSIEGFELLVSKAFDGDSFTFNWTFKIPDCGTIVPTEVTLVRLRHKNEYIVASYIRDLRDIAHMEKKISELETEVEKVYIDALTGIYNRRYFDDRMKQIISNLSHSGSDLSVLMVDIDCFKKYNDNYGHNEGDICLVSVTQAISESVTRKDDFVARYGGEEFVVVLPNTDSDSSCAIAERILDNIRNRSIPHKYSDVADIVTASIGIVTDIPTFNQSGSDFVKLADEMLYLSKKGGRNRFTHSRDNQGENPQ